MPRQAYERIAQPPREREKVGIGHAALPQEPVLSVQGRVQPEKAGVHASERRPLRSLLAGGLATLEGTNRGPKAGCASLVSSLSASCNRARPAGSEAGGASLASGNRSAMSNNIASASVTTWPSSSTKAGNFGFWVHFQIIGTSQCIAAEHLQLIRATGPFERDMTGERAAPRQDVKFHRFYSVEFHGKGWSTPNSA